MARISFLTSTYNRAEKLKRLYESIVQSVNRDFEWVIVIDGSNDGTVELVKEFQMKADFSIVYKFQENSGKHIALNQLFEMATGEYCFIIDDDDEILPDTIDHGLKIIDNLSLEDRKKYWCIVGRCINQNTRKIVGREFAANVNDLKGRALKKEVSVGGECCSFMNTSIMKQYKFPEVRGCSYFPEGNLWERIDQDYEQYYTNEIFRVYHQQEGESLISYSKTSASYIKRYNMYKYLLSAENPLKSKVFSRRHIAELYKYRLFSDKMDLTNEEVYSGVSNFNKLLLRMSKIPCRMLQKRRNE